MMRSIYAVLAIVQLLCIRESCVLGAPTTTCSLTPEHGSPLAGTTPFQIGVKQVSTDELQVTISSNDNTTIQGFILQAREVGTMIPVGRFSATPPLTHTINCTSGQDTVTHSSNISSKTSLQFTWIPPVNFSGTIRFNATVVVSEANFSRGIVSDEISLPLSTGVQASPYVSNTTQTLLQPFTTMFLPQTAVTNQPLAKTPSISETLQQQATFSVLVKDSAGNYQTASQVSLSQVTDIEGGLLLSTTIEQLFHSVTMPVSPSAMVKESSPIANQVVTSQVGSEADQTLLVSTFIQLKQTLSKMLEDTTPVVLSSTSQPSQLQPELTMSQVGSSVLPSETVQQQSVSATNEAQTSAILEDSSPAPQTSPLLSPFLPQFTSALLEASQTISETAQQPSFSFQAEVSSSNMVKESTPVGEVFFTLGSKSSQQLLQPSITQASASSIVLPSPFPKTPSLSQPASVPQLPSSAETLPVAELSSLVQSSPIAQTPSVSQTPTLVELPSVAQTLRVSQSPSLMRFPSVVQYPSVSQSSTLVELPSVAQTLRVSQSLSLVESPSVAQTPSVSQSPTLVDLPSVAQTLRVSQSPSFVVIPFVAQTPSISPVESSLVAQTPSAFQTPTPVELPSVAQTLHESQSLSLVESPLVAQTPSVSQSSTIIELPSVAQTLRVFQSPSFVESPSVAQTPSVSQSPTLVELPPVAQTLRVSQSPSLVESPLVAQTPLVSQSSTLVELTSVAQTLRVSQSPSLVESPLVAQTPSESQPPTLVDLPSVAQTLLVSQSPSLVELSSIAQSPSVSPVESSLVVQTPSAFQSLTLTQSQSVAILPSLSQSPQLVESTSIDQSLSTNISILFSPSISQITSIPVPSSSSQLSSMSSIIVMSPTRQSSFPLQSSSVNQTLATTKPLQTTVNQSGSVVVEPTLSQSTLIVQLTVNQTSSIASTQKEILPSTSQMVLTTTQPPTQGTVNTIVSFSIMRDFDQKLEDKMSREYRELTNTIEKEVENVYRNDGIEVDVTVRSLRRGSIIAVLLIVFQNQTQLPDSPLQLLKAAITDNKLGNLSVDPNSFSLRFDECDRKCHQNATCAKSTTSVSFSCKCNPGLTGNGVQCTEEKKDDDDDKEIKDLLIASIVIVSVILLVVLLMFMCLLCRICKNK